MRLLGPWVMSSTLRILPQLLFSLSQPEPAPTTLWASVASPQRGKRGWDESELSSSSLSPNLREHLSQLPARVRFPWPPSWWVVLDHSGSLQTCERQLYHRPEIKSLPSPEPGLFFLQLLPICPHSACGPMEHTCSLCPVIVSQSYSGEILTCRPHEVYTCPNAGGHCSGPCGVFPGAAPLVTCHLYSSAPHPP